MNKGTAIAIGSISLAAAAAAYYFFVVLKNQENAGIATQNIQSGIDTANSTSGRSFTVNDLNARQWKNNAGTVIPSGTIVGYNANTGQIQHKESAWTGTLLDANTIAWVNADGRTDTWKALNGLGNAKLFY